VSPELLELEASVGAFLEYWGFKKIHGRLWTHLFLSEAPMSTTELLEKLQVSPALMSSALSELIEHQVIREEKKAAHGLTFYSANSDISAVIANVLKSRELPMLTRVRAALETLQKNSSSLQGSKDRLQQIGEMTRVSERMLKTFIQVSQIKRGLPFVNLLKRVKIGSGA
jgi:DNA-binding transcriptional regulator GbsR (MarR family)